ncbi:hypothetical protein EDM52_05815 [Brevibacillus invocatus]|uniref:Transcription initiation factor TFIID n=1 Tax=Brevibacillus invocatus TaxID=173959 RepID=A0A3M8CM31_9BACL|nr:hypothetical protein [Brevibacillus invocatus]RNB75925.1 hypothetical protein EDM52_05815 [Brevibacillus invocatus]
MRELLDQFATEYVTDMERQLDNGIGQRNIQNPVLFLFLGDKSLDALQAVCLMNEQKWHNSEAVLYIHAYEKETWEHPLLHGFRLPGPDSDKRKMRSSLYEYFARDESILMELNKTMKQASVRVAEMGKQFTSFQQVNLAVVTRADDPANVLLPELTLVLKSYLAELFKNVSMDLYVLLQERGGEEFGFSAALGVSFLEELNRYQQRDYSYHADLLVTSDLVKLPVEHDRAPLFSLVYLLSDKNEHGMFLEAGMRENYELISHLVLLQNKGAEVNSSDSFSKVQFVRNMTGSREEATFASAGLSKVKRPTHAIALTVLSAVYDTYRERLKQGAIPDKSSVRERLGLMSHDLQRQIRLVFPDESKRDEMGGLMTSGVSYKELAPMTLREAEQALFEGSSQSFFETNLVRPVYQRLEDLLREESLASIIQEEIVGDPRYGLYAAYQITSEQSSVGHLLNELRVGIRETSRELELARAELEEIYQQRVDRQEIRVGGLFTRDKERVRAFVRHLFDLLYGKKLEILEGEIILRILQERERQVGEIHRQIGRQIEQLEELQKQLREHAQRSIREAADYLGKNIEDYYGSLVREAIGAMETQRGADFYLESRYIGTDSLQLYNGVAGLIERLCRFCRTEILPRPAFALPFDADLLARANVAAAYENRAVLTRDDLFRDLAFALEERAAVHIEVFHFLQKHRYEEKYLFADTSNDFVQFVLHLDEGNRSYKQGCIHEDRKSGIEKLNLMGGFGMEDLMYYRNNKKYHTSYQDNGFSFAAEERMNRHETKKD